jgi:hypothetical protein
MARTYSLFYASRTVNLFLNFLVYPQVSAAIIQEENKYIKKRLIRIGYDPTMFNVDSNGGKAQSTALNKIGESPPGDLQHSTYDRQLN